MAKSHSFIGWIAGILSTVIGGLMLFWLTTGQQAQLTSTSISPPSPAVSPIEAAMVDFEITNQLGDGQVTEQVAVVIDGRSVGTLTVDVVHRTASLTVTVPGADVTSMRCPRPRSLKTSSEPHPSARAMASGTFR